MHAPASKPELPKVQRRALRAVASFEFVKAIFVLAMGLCAVLLVHRDVWLMAESLLALLHVNTDWRFAQLFLDFADNVTDARLWDAARFAFAYSGLRFAEAYGLWKARPWAEWVALISGTLLLPVEVRELFRGVNLMRSLIFVGNLAIVLYMLYLLRASHRQRQAASNPPTQG
jgi:uncharacterized membrane protein (DUF2068 family)